MLKHHGIKVNSSDKNVKIIQNWINSFIDELNIYGTSNLEPEPWRKYAERPMVGLLTTGISRKDTDGHISILQEFGVYNKDKFLGRCDLFVGAKKTAYLIECKYGNGKGGRNHWTNVGDEKYLNSIYQQCKKYLDAEIDEYSIYDNTYLVVLIFRQISHTDSNKFLNHISSAKKYEPLLENEFYTFITLDKVKPSGNWYSGLEVHGYMKKKE